MQLKHIQRAGLAALILLLGLLTACTGSGETSAVEPQTVVLTQVVTQIVIPTALPKPTKTPEPAEGVSSAGYGGFDPYSVPIYYPLNGCSASRLAVGDEAYVTYSGGLVGLYRYKDLAQEPDLRYPTTGTYVNIVEGPFCTASKWIYWRVEIPTGSSPEDVIEGYFPEGDGDQYWMMPTGYAYDAAWTTETPHPFAGILKVSFPKYRASVRRGCSREGK